MILRRYGTSMQSVELNFDSNALTEIGFRRDRQHSVPVETFDAEWERVEEYALEGTAEGWVQGEVEQDLLDRLASRIDEILQSMADGEVLLVESEQGGDYPKTRGSSKVVVDGSENRLFFKSWVEPPLRLGRYRKRG